MILKEVWVMAKICTSVQQLIGNTPLLELQSIAREEGLCARLLAKLEFRELSRKLCGRAAAQDSPEDLGELFAAATPKEEPMQEDLFSTPTLATAATTPHHYHLIRTEEERCELAARLETASRMDA